MKILFLDDSFRRSENYLGYGGYCIDASYVRNLVDDLYSLKRSFNIPPDVELKWSPKNRFLKNLKEDRQVLYRESIDLLQRYNATVICAVHNLSECYGVSLYGWDQNCVLLWAAKQQFKFIMERFEKHLSTINDVGLIVADRYSEVRKEPDLMRDLFHAIMDGTSFQRFERIGMIPLMTNSEFCPPIQIADIIIGVAVGSLAQSRYALELFENLVRLFLKNPLAGASSLSHSVLGFGLKLFPKSFRPKGKVLFGELDQIHSNTTDGIIAHI